MISSSERRTRLCHDHDPRYPFIHSFDEEETGTYMSQTPSIHASPPIAREKRTTYRRTCDHYYVIIIYLGTTQKTSL